MKIGLAFDVRDPSVDHVSDGPDDAQEEFDSPETIRALSDALTALGHEVVELGDGEPALRRLLDGPRPDLVFNIAEGVGAGRCREARLPAALELLGVPYTGSDPLTLAVTLDKDVAKRLVAARGVAVPEGVLVDGEDVAPYAAALEALAWPRIVKPAFEGSSKGIKNASLVHDRKQMTEAVRAAAADYRQAVLVEEFIDGDELTVGLVGTPLALLGVMRVVPKMAEGPFVYSLEVKRDWERLVSYETPAQLPASISARVGRDALSAAQALGIQDVGRVDFRLRDGVPYFLEANPLPGLSPKYGDLVLLARGVDVSHGELVERILRAACLRLGLG